jgi:phosphomannomutase
MHKIRQAAFSATIFKTYEVRGRYPDELNDKAAYAIARAFVEYCALRLSDRPPHIVVARTGEKREESLSKVFIEAARREGASIIDIGYADASLLVFAEKHFDADGAVLMCVGGVDDRESVVRFWARDVCPLSTTEMEALGKSATRSIFDYEKERGSYREENITAQYRRAMMSHVAFDVAMRARVRVLTSNVLVRDDLKEMLHDFPGIKILDEKREAPSKFRCSVFLFEVSTDEMGESIHIKDENGQIVTPSVLAALYIDHIVRSGETCVLDIAIHQKVHEIAEKKGVSVLTSPSGSSHIVGAIQEQHARFGAARNGRYYFHEWHGNCSGVYMILALIEICARADKSLSQLVQPYKDIVEYSEMFLDIKNPEVVLDKIAGHFQDGVASYQDGLSVAYSNWRFVLRPADTFTGLCLFVEGDDGEFVEQKIKLLSELIEL